MHGFGSHTYSLINAAGERHWVKFHFKSQQGIQNLDEAEAAAIISGDRESHQRDLYEAIERKEFPRWRTQIQEMSEARREKRPINFDLTRLPHKDFPLIEIGSSS